MVVLSPLHQAHDRRPRRHTCFPRNLFSRRREGARASELFNYNGVEDEGDGCGFREMLFKNHKERFWFWHPTRFQVLNQILVHVNELVYFRLPSRRTRSESGQRVIHSQPEG